MMRTPNFSLLLACFLVLLKTENLSAFTVVTNEKFSSPLRVKKTSKSILQFHNNEDSDIQIEGQLMSAVAFTTRTSSASSTKLFMARGDKFFTNQRRDKLGLDDKDEEYDLDVALNTNTDPLITKLIAGSFILVVLALLVAGVVVPSLTDYGEGVCSPIQNGGRC